MYICEGGCTLRTIWSVGNSILAENAVVEKSTYKSV